MLGIIGNFTQKIQESPYLHEDWRLISIVSLFSLACAIVIGTDLPRPDALTSAIALIVWLLPAWYLGYGKNIPVVMISTILLGITVAQHRLDQTRFETIERETFVTLTAQVIRTEYRIDRPTRVTLRVTSINRLQWLVGNAVRLTVRTDMPANLPAGSIVEVDAIVAKPPGPIVPGGFDFARYSRFQGIAAQGFAVSTLKPVGQAAENPTLSTIVENQRTNLSNRILDTLKQPVGGVAVALITGQRQYLDQDTAIIIRDAGLAHLLAISGLHMGLITGAAFFVFEILFAAIPSLALRVPPRKLAAVAAWGMAVVYLALSGASTSTIRAFIMVSIGILAVLTDRRVISLRSVAVAAGAILILTPEAILASGFQMSFAATIAIIVAYDHITLRRKAAGFKGKKVSERSWASRLALYFFGVLGTSLVAQLAVGPIALFHFQAISVAGVAANLIAIPVVAFVVMPAAFASILASFLGLATPFLLVMGQGIEFVVAVATTVAGLETAVYRAGPFSGLLPAAAALSFLLVMLWRHYSSIVLAILCLTATFPGSSNSPAIILIANGGRVIGTPTDKGQLAVTGGRRDGFRTDAWQRYWNISQNTEVEPLNRICTSRGCKSRITLSQNNRSDILDIYTSRSLETTRSACAAAAIVIASYSHRRHCRGAALFLAEEDIDKFGPVGLWLADTTVARREIKYQWSNPSPK